MRRFLDFFLRSRLRISAALVVVGILLFAALHWRTPQAALPVQRGDLTETVYGLATVKANRTYNLRIAVPSRLRRLYVRQGDEVAAGAALAEFDEMPPVRAPFEGVVTTLNYNTDEIVVPQMSILTITDFKDRYLLVSLEERGALRIKRGQAARVSFEGLRNVRFDCSVGGLYPDEGQFQVRVQCPGLPREILPGMTADVLIEVGRKSGVLLIPLSAMQEKKLRVLRGSSEIEVQIQPGANDGDLVEVKSGDLRDGDRIIVPEAKH